MSDAESFKFDDLNYLTAIGSKEISTDLIMGQFIGLFRINANLIPRLIRLLEDFPDIVYTFDTTMILSLLLRLGCRIKCIPLNSYWCEIDSLSDLRVAEQMLREGKLHKHAT